MKESPMGTTATTSNRSALLGYVSLFSSFGTLLCCALPSLLVLVGLGATVASFLSSVPVLVTLSHHKNWVFAVSGLLIAANFAYVYMLVPKLLAGRGACPPDDPNACEAASRTSRVVLWISGLIYLGGFFTAYVLGPLLMRFG
jgi:mercuric ion transport protein